MRKSQCKYRIYLHIPFQSWNKPKLRLIPRDYQQNMCKQKSRFPKMRHYCGTMEDRTSSAEISRQGAFRVDSNTNTFRLPCLCKHGGNRHYSAWSQNEKTLRCGMELKRKREVFRACCNIQSAGLVAPGLSRHV
jgi:hypothetical protein